jgi:hypothetical protein
LGPSIRQNSIVRGVYRIEVVHCSGRISGITDPLNEFLGKARVALVRQDDALDHRLEFARNPIEGAVCDADVQALNARRLASQPYSLLSGDFLSG